MPEDIPGRRDFRGSGWGDQGGLVRRHAGVDLVRYPEPWMRLRLDWQHAGRPVLWRRRSQSLRPHFVRRIHAQLACELRPHVGRCRTGRTLTPPAMGLFRKGASVATGVSHPRWISQSIAASHPRASDEARGPLRAVRGTDPSGHADPGLRACCLPLAVARDPRSGTGISASGHVAFRLRSRAFRERACCLPPSVRATESGWHGDRGGKAGERSGKSR